MVVFGGNTFVSFVVLFLADDFCSPASGTCSSSPSPSPAPNTPIHEVTKGKMERLRRSMEERKAKRRARREARAAPYSTSWSVQSEPSAGQNENGVTAENGEVSDDGSEAANPANTATSPAAAATPAPSTESRFNSEPEPVTA